MSEQEPISMLCPVCRARQIVQPQCRRCSADLELYGKALAAVQDSKHRYAAALHQGDAQAAQRELIYLTWLSPAEATQASRGATETGSVN